MTCSKCASDVVDGAAFCASCGTPTRNPDAATVAIAAQPAPEDALLVAVRDALASFYVVEKELGRGGMAVVYRGKEKGLEREVAIKVLPPEMALQGGTADRFRREARLAASLEHQNIIPVYRVGEEKNLIYMAMKFVRGRALDSIIESQGALPINVVTRILAAAAAGLAHAHEHGVVHRDIKGANILIELDGRPLVADFGIARAMTENSLTASGMVIGTPNFMSPEQCGGSKVGPQSDQYSLGILGFQLLTGQLPFEADSIMGIIQHHYMTPPPDILAVREGVPQELLDVIYKALAKKPEDRFAHTSEMAEALDSVPLTMEEKRESLAILKQLSQGEKVATYRIESLPPLSLTASISGQRASVGPAASSGAKTELLSKKGAPGAKPKPQPKGKGGLIAAAATVLLLGAGGAYWGLVMRPAQQAAAALQLQQQQAAAAAAARPPAPVVVTRPAAPAPSNPAPAPRNEPRRPAQQQPTPTITAPPVAAPVGKGSLQMAGGAGCGNVEIQVDGARVGTGRRTMDVNAGAHVVRFVPETGNPVSVNVTVTAGQLQQVIGTANGLSCGS